MEFEKTSVKKGANHCSRNRLLLLLLFAQIIFLVWFYFSCQINMFDCQTMAKSFTFSDHHLWNQQEKQNNESYQTTLNITKTATNNINRSISELFPTIHVYSDTLSPNRDNSKSKEDPKKTLKFYANYSMENLPHQIGNTSKTYRLHQSTKHSSISYRTIQVTGTNNAFVEGIIRFHNISCTPLHPEVLLYNRIFKTASSSVSEFMLKESSLLNYTMETATTEDWYKTGNPFPYPDIIARHVGATSLRYAFVGHFFFRRHLGVGRRYTYMNLVREPVRRVVSHYAYMRTTMRPRMRIEEMKRSGQWNETLRHCIKMEHRGCESNVMVHFFCGPQPFCKTGSKKALKQAKMNIRRYYSVVGLQEHLKSFLEILSVRLPYFFRQGNMKLGHEKQNRNTYFEKVKPSLKKLIRHKNSADLDLYKFIRNRFWKLEQMCGRHSAV